MALTEPNLVTKLTLKSSILGRFRSFFGQLEMLFREDYESVLIFQTRLIITEISMNIYGSHGAEFGS